MRNLKIISDKNAAYKPTKKPVRQPAFTMMPLKLLSFIMLTFVACSSPQQSSLPLDSLQEAERQDATHYADLYPLVIQDLEKKHVTENGNYYMLTRFSDSTVKITWGNDTIKTDV